MFNVLLIVLLGLRSLTTSNQGGIIRLQDLIHVIIIIIIQFNVEYCWNEQGGLNSIKPIILHNVNTVLNCFTLKVYCLCYVY